MKSLKYIFFSFIICFIALNTALAEVCIYEGSGLELRCSLSQGTFASSTDYSASCSFIGSTVKYSDVNYTDNKVTSVTETNDKLFSRTMTLKGTNFMNSDGSVNCDNVKNIYMDFNTLNSTTTPEIYDLRADSNCQYNNDVYNYQPNMYYDKSDFRGCKALLLSNSEEGESSNNGFIDKNENNNETSGGTKTDKENTFNEESFCTGSVLNVFNALGWIIYALKILIPIILIVLGTIDFGKAIIASKDDEIKKSAKTLFMRVIAGIIIFFIPTIVNLIITLIGGENVYNGTNFGPCTKCILNPFECDKGSDN